jgi:hypothetical protein
MKMPEPEQRASPRGGIRGSLQFAEDGQSPGHVMLAEFKIVSTCEKCGRWLALRRDDRKVSRSACRGDCHTPVL